MYLHKYDLNVVVWHVVLCFWYVKLNLKKASHKDSIF